MKGLVSHAREEPLIHWNIQHRRPLDEVTVQEKLKCPEIFLLKYERGFLNFGFDQL